MGVAGCPCAALWGRPEPSEPRPPASRRRGWSQGSPAHSPSTRLYGQPARRLSCSVQWLGRRWAGQPSPVITGLGYSGPLALHPLAPGVWDGTYFPAGCGLARTREAPTQFLEFPEGCVLPSRGALGWRWPRSAPLHAPRWAPAFSPPPAVTLREAPPLSEAPLSHGQSGEADPRLPGLCVVLG